MKCLASRIGVQLFHFSFQIFNDANETRVRNQFLLLSIKVNDKDSNIIALHGDTLKSLLWGQAQRLSYCSGMPLKRTVNVDIF